MPWTDITSSLPSAKSFDLYCFCPGPIGTSAFDKSAYFNNPKQNFASLYICGDENFAPNIRNALGTDRRWDWYSHLSQHPLVSPAYATQGSLKGITNTLLQTASYDRLVDESRLYAHRLGLENQGRITRIEVYRDMVHVHQVLVLLFKSARVATKNLARFVERSQHMRDEEEHKTREEAAVASGERSYAAMLRKVPVRDQNHGHHHQNNEHGSGEVEYVPAYLLPLMVKEKAADGVEWVMVDQDGRELAGDEGVPSLEKMANAWVPRNIEE
ncbi:hypothetical protein EDD21DRAFT_383642 [Dissophora ornata]|nr:hypothetical protein EDD21DRAFT_383642 [Dissophora ornata]